MPTHDLPDEIPRDHLCLALGLVGLNPSQITEVRITPMNVVVTVKNANHNGLRPRLSFVIPITNSTTKETT